MILFATVPPFTLTFSPAAFEAELKAALLGVLVVATTIVNRVRVPVGTDDFGAGPRVDVWVYVTVPPSAFAMLPRLATETLSLGRRSRRWLCAIGLGAPYVMILLVLELTWMFWWCCVVRR